MKTVYTPDEIERILEATIGPAPDADAPDPSTRRARVERRARFIDEVGRQAAAEILAMEDARDCRIEVFAGDDMCGAYALAAATALTLAGCNAGVCLFNIGGDMLSADCAAARSRYLESCGPDMLTEVISPGANFTMPHLDENTIVVDGLFGSDYQKPLRGGYQAVARYINESVSSPRVVSIDIPSGMTLNLSVGMVNRNIIHADLTLVIVGPTLAFFMPENAILLGKWKTLKLPVKKNVITHPSCRVVDAKAIRGILPPREPFVHKNELGTALIYAGSYGMLGAAVLATRAACRSGCGKVICHGPRCGFYVLQSSAPSAMFETDGSDFDIQRFESQHNADAIAIGPGLGHSDATIYGLERYLKTCHSQGRPVILDADALNCIARHPSLLDFIPPGSVLTPHAGEFDRLFGNQNNHSTRLLKAIEVAMRYNIIMVLKGHYTFTIWPPDGEILVNASGTPALATAGSGDVLTGLLAGLVAQGIAPEIAAVAAVYLHGIAGKLAQQEHGVRGSTAEDIADYVGTAIEYVCNPPERRNNK